MSKTSKGLVLAKGMSEQNLNQVINAVIMEREALTSNYVRDEKPLALQIEAVPVDKDDETSRLMEIVINGNKHRVALGRGADPKQGTYSLWKVTAKANIEAGTANGVSWRAIKAGTPALRLYPAVN